MLTTILKMPVVKTMMWRRRSWVRVNLSIQPNISDCLSSIATSSSSLMLLLLPLSGTQMLRHDEDANSSATE